MKKICVLFFTSFLFANIFCQVRVNSSGDVGVGCDPDTYRKLKLDGQMRVSGGSGGGTVAPLEIVSNYAVYGLHLSGPTLTNYLIYVNGSAYSTSSWVSSDMQFKKNVTNLDGGQMLSKIQKINGKKYEFKAKEELESVISSTLGKSDFNVIPQFPAGNQYGLIAQELEKEFPELVNLDSISNSKAINYNGMIPILLEALKEQQNQIVTLQQIITEHEKEILALKEQTEEIEPILKKTTYVEGTSTKEEIVTLYQNTPNPFNQKTEIKFFIPQNISTAKIYIHDLNGGQIKVYELYEKGNGSLEIKGSELNKGMYLYTLIADDIIIDTKRMILTD